MTSGGAAGPRRPAPGWQARRLLEAPHRLCFAAGALVMAASALWWAAVRTAAMLGLAPAWALAPGPVHGLLAGFGAMPLFIAGFVFTAGPKWLRVAPVPARALGPAVALQLAGWGMLLVAAHGTVAPATAVLAAGGVALAAAGWARCWWHLLGLLRRSGAPDTLHLRLVAVAGGLGLLALAGAALGLARGDALAVRAATLAGLHGFIGLVFVAAAHRMIPFFGDGALPALEARAPHALLWLLVALMALRTLQAAASWAAPVVAATTQAAVGACELATGAVLLASALGWRRRRQVKGRLLAMLFAGFAWLAAATTLSGLQGLGAIAPSLAPLHAYTAGFLGSTLLAMATRVSAGQAGRAVAADAFAWRLFGLLQLAAIARVAAALPPWAGRPAGDALVTAAAGAWALVWLAWAARHGRWWGRPRPDGRPG